MAALTALPLGAIALSTSVVAQEDPVPEEPMQEMPEETPEETLEETPEAEPPIEDPEAEPEETPATDPVEDPDETPAAEPDVIPEDEPADPPTAPVDETPEEAPEETTPVPETVPETPPTDIPEAPPEEVTPPATPEAESDALNLSALPNGNYRVVSADLPFETITDERLLETGGALFLFRKFGDEVTGVYSFIDSEGGSCIAGTLEGNTVTGESFAYSENPREGTFLTLGTPVGEGRYEGSVLDLSSFSRINAGTRLPVESCP